MATVRAAASRRGQQAGAATWRGAGQANEPQTGCSHPEVPTLAEAGLPDAESDAWIGLVAPAATPAPVAARLAEEARTALGDPRTRGVLEGAGFEVVASGPEEFTRFAAAE